MWWGKNKFIECTSEPNRNDLRILQWLLDYLRLDSHLLVWIICIYVNGVRGSGRTGVWDCDARLGFPARAGPSRVGKGQPLLAAGMCLTRLGGRREIRVL